MESIKDVKEQYQKLQPALEDMKKGLEQVFTLFALEAAVKGATTKNIIVSMQSVMSGFLIKSYLSTADCQDEELRKKDFMWAMSGMYDTHTGTRKVDVDDDKSMEENFGVPPSRTN